MNEISWLALAVISLAAFVQGFLGFGFGILAMGILSAAWELKPAAALVNLCCVVLHLTILWPLWKKVQWRVIAPVILMSLPGLGLGVYGLIKLNPDTLRQLLGLTIIGFALWSFLDRQNHRPLSRAWSVPSGLALGVLEGAFNMGGPPAVAYVYRHPFEPEALKASVQVMFFITMSLRIPLVAAQGMITKPVLLQTLPCLPAIIIMATLGMVLSRKVSSERFRSLVWIGFGLMGFYLFAK